MLKCDVYSLMDRFGLASNEDSLDWPILAHVSVKAEFFFAQITGLDDVDLSQVDDFPAFLFSLPIARSGSVSHLAIQLQTRNPFN